VIKSEIGDLGGILTARYEPTIMTRLRRDAESLALCRVAKSVTRRCVLLKPNCLIISILVLLSATSASAGAQTYTLRWADEFDGPAGSVPDQAKWNYDIAQRLGQQRA